jgi:hemolysin activation/secretion protein
MPRSEQGLPLSGGLPVIGVYGTVHIQRQAAWRAGWPEVTVTITDQSRKSIRAVTTTFVLCATAGLSCAQLSNESTFSRGSRPAGSQDPLGQMTVVRQADPEPKAEGDQLGETPEESVESSMVNQQAADGSAGGQEDAQRAPELFAVSQIDIILDPEHPGLPTVAELMELPVALVRDGSLLTVPAVCEAVTPILIKDIGSGGIELMTREAIREVLDRIEAEFDRRQLLGKLVIVNPQDILLQPPDGFDGLTDFRGERTELTVIVLNGVIRRVRTVASGERFGLDARLNNPSHVRILKNSPRGPVEEAERTEDNMQRDLLRRDLLDDYVLRLNRFPGRRVDVALAPGDAPGEVTLDYLVSENKQWLAYSQFSNTGTESTEDWRQRFGAQISQLSNRDDILSVEYITSGFSSSHALLGAYEAPLPGTDRLRGRVFADYSKFTASDVGLANEKFTGEGYTVGGELIWNVYQDREFFVDLFGGARWNQTEVYNEAVDLQGREQFLVPKLGVRAEAITDTWTFNAESSIEWSMADISAGKLPGIESLGRLAPDEDWSVVRYGASGSFFLEPLLLGSKWKDASTWQTSTLAHEIALSVRGQWSMDNRLIPNEQQVVGGLYSVRGYPESVVAGDNVVMATAEYRWHIPRSFRPLSVPDASGNTREPWDMFGRQFRQAPPSVYGRPDWDLVFKAFTDIGRSQNTERQAFEKDEDLWGAGLGFDFLYYRNLSVRVDWAVALDEVDNQNVKSGSNRFHMVFTLLF